VHVRVSEHVCTCKLFLMPSVLVFMFLTEIMSFPMLMFININICYQIVTCLPNTGKYEELANTVNLIIVLYKYFITLPQSTADNVKLESPVILIQRKVL